MLIGEPEDRWVVASDAGYGFVVRLAEMHSRNRAGKAVLKVPEGAGVVPPVPVPGDDALLAAATNEGRLLVFAAADLPELPRGKGDDFSGCLRRKSPRARNTCSRSPCWRPVRRLRCGLAAGA